MSTMPDLGDPCHQSVEPRDRLHRHLRVGDAVQREATSAWRPMSRTISPHAGKDEVARTGDTSIPGIAQRAPPNRSSSGGMPSARRWPKTTSGVPAMPSGSHRLA